MRRVKRILSCVLVLCMCFTLFFMPKYTVNAVDSTYYLYSDLNSNLQLTKGSATWYFQSNTTSRVVCLSAQGYTQYNYIYMIFETSPVAGVSPSLPVSTSNVGDSETYNGKRYYYIKLGYSLSNENVNVPIVYVAYGNQSNVSYAIKYTFGDGAIDPEPPGPTYGRVADVEYATRIAGSGLASADNIDRIVWNQSVDTNGNELPTGSRVQIRAVPGKYVGNTANDVLNKTYVDFILDHSKQLIIVDIIASRGVYETKWSEVVDHFGFFPYSWVPNIQYLDNEYFKMGWIYQIRLQVDDYYSDWQNIYTATGSGASESQTITDSDEISQQLVQDINIVNQLNNTTTTNWYINETTINNSEYTENTNGKPWWAYLLEAILSLFQIGDGEQQIINNTNNLNIDLYDKLNEYNEIEDQQLNNLDTNLEAIEVESDMLENNKFVGSANWVAQQYTRMTNGTVIGSLIGFSLLFGLALIFIGKIR